MKTTMYLLATGIFLDALGTGFGQTALQFSTNNFQVIEHAGSLSLMVQRAGDTNAEVSVDFAANELAFTNDPSSPQPDVPMSEWAVALLQAAAGDQISSQPSPQDRTETGDKPAVIYSTGLELMAVNPINVVRSKKHPGIEYSGICVQAARSNPLQLINPFAPDKYGNGDANVVRHFLTGEVEGWKLWRISF